MRPTGRPRMIAEPDHHVLTGGFSALPKRRVPPDAWAVPGGGIDFHLSDRKAQKKCE